MSKATCITDQIGFLWKITCKHTVSNLAQKRSFATAKKSTYLGMGFGEQPSHPHRPKFAPKHFTALPPHLLGKVSAALKRWTCPYGFKGLTIPDSQFSHELPLTDPWKWVYFQPMGSAMREDSSTVWTLIMVIKRNVKMMHLQRASECLSGFSQWIPENRAHLHPLLKCKLFNSFLAAHGHATLVVPCRISSPCSQTWSLHSITMSTSHVSSTDSIWGANTATAKMLALELWIPYVHTEPWVYLLREFWMSYQNILKTVPRRHPFLSILIYSQTFYA